MGLTAKRAVRASMLMSARTDIRFRACIRRGFSLMEILVVLAIFALSTALIMPSTARMLDQTTGHAVFFEFQRQVSDLRREANRTGQAIRIIDPAQYNPSRADDDGARVIELREPWTYRLEPTLDIAEGGICTSASVDLLNRDKVVMSVRTRDGTCRFVRHQIEQPR